MSLSGGKKIPLIAACLLHIAICGVICRPVFWSPYLKEIPYGYADSFPQ